MPGIDFLSCWYMVKKARKEVTLAPWRVFLPEMLLHRQGHHAMEIELFQFQYIIPFSHCILYRLC